MNPTRRPPHGQQAGHRALEGLIAASDRAEALPARARTVEAADALRDLRDDLQRVGVRLSAEQMGPDAWATLLDLARRLPEAWASGADASPAR